MASCFDSGLELVATLRVWLQCGDMTTYKEEEGLARALLGCGQGILKDRGCIFRSRRPPFPVSNDGALFTLGVRG